MHGSQKVTGLGYMEDGLTPSSLLLIFVLVFFIIC
jgi:hypothetical protein